MFQKNKNQFIFYDLDAFKGNIYEKNIKSLNSLFLGQGIKIRSIPYIYHSNEDNKTYLSAISFTIKSTLNQKSKTIYIPLNFLYFIQYYDGLLFFLDSSNKLFIFEFKEDSYTKYSIEQDGNIKESTIEKKNIEEIKESLETANKIENMADNYKALCDILEVQLNVELNLKNPKNFDKLLQFKIERKTLNYLCTFESYKYEVDSTGKIREKLHVEKGKISFAEGINN